MQTERLETELEHCAAILHNCRHVQLYINHNMHVVTLWLVFSSLMLIDCSLCKTFALAAFKCSVTQDVTSKLQ